MPLVNKVDSNITGLRYCEETVTLGVLPAAANQRWIELESNSYSDFGGQLTTLARNPINPSRQRKKGVVTNVEASGGFNTDLTQENLQDLLQGFMFATLRRKVESGQGTVGAVTSVSSTQYVTTGANFTNFRVGDLIFGVGFASAANNGLKVVTASTATTVSAAGLVVDAAPAAGSGIRVVGFEFGSGEVNIDVSGSLPRLVRASGTKDFTQFGLIPGELIFIGGDATVNAFNTATNNGLCRVRSVGTTFIEFDKTSGAMSAETGTGKQIRLFFGRVLRNETGTLIRRRSYNLERTLGFSEDTLPNNEQAEYIEGAVPSELTANIGTADKVNLDLSFLATRSTLLNENDGGVTLKSKVAGTTRVPVREADAFNTSSDISRIRLATVVPGNPFPSPLFAYATEVTLTINNNLNPNGAVGVLGAFDISAGTFEVGGNITAYFNTTASVLAVRNNADITLDVFIVKSNAGVAIDVPLITLGEGRPNVEQDQAITLPFSQEAATGAKIDPNLNHTLLWVFFDFLPNRADV